MRLVSLEYNMNGRVADKIINIEQITSIERRDNLTGTVKFIGGYSIDVKPKIADKLVEMLVKLSGAPLAEVKDSSD